MTAIRIHDLKLRRRAAEPVAAPPQAVAGEPAAAPARTIEMAPLRAAALEREAVDLANRRAAEAAAQMLDDFRKALTVPQAAIVDLVVGAVAEIIGQIPDRQQAELLVRTALKHLRPAHGVVMRLAPADRHGAAFAELQASPEFGEIIDSVVADAGLAPGECILEARGATIRVDAAGQIAALRRLLVSSAA